MAGIFRQNYTRRDPKTGQIIRKKSRRYYIEYADAMGIRRRVRGHVDKEATLQLAAQLKKKAALEASGVVDPYAEHRKRPISEHVKDYESSLKAKGDTDKHVRLTIGRIESVIEGCGFKLIGDLSASRIAEWLAEQREKGRSGNQENSEKDKGKDKERSEKAKGLSSQTSNFYLSALKTFARWLVRDRRMGESPLIHLSGVNVKVDRRHDRRALSPHDFAKLVQAARTGKEIRGLSGPDRAMLYQVAAYTGLRASELASLSRTSFDLDATPPTVTVEAGYSKHRRKDILPLRADLVALLRNWIGDASREAGSQPKKPAGKVLRLPKESASKQAPLLWPGNWKEDAAEMIHEDLDKAGIPYQDSAGLFFDFHALRHQFLTTLARSGAHPKETQILARHSTIDLTMDRYTHLGLVDLTGALDRLPGLPGQADIEPERATGTEGGSTAAGSQLDPRSAVQGVQDSGPKGKKEADGNAGHRLCLQYTAYRKIPPRQNSVGFGYPEAKFERGALLRAASSTPIFARPQPSREYKLGNC